MIEGIELNTKYSSTTRSNSKTLRLVSFYRFTKYHTYLSGINHLCQVSSTPTFQTNSPLLPPNQTKSNRTNNVHPFSPLLHLQLDLTLTHTLTPPLPVLNHLIHTPSLAAQQDVAGHQAARQGAPRECERVVFDCVWIWNRAVIP